MHGQSRLKEGCVIDREVEVLGTMEGSVIRQADRYDLAEDSHYAAVDL